MITDDVAGRTGTPAGHDEGGPLTLGQRMRQPQTLLSFLFATLIVVFLVRRLDIDPGEVWRQLRSANLFLFGLAVAVFYAGFLVRSLRLRWMLTQAGVAALPDVRLPSNRGLMEIMLLGWFANCVAPARLGDVYRAYLLKRRANAPFTTSMGVIAAERLIDLVVLVLLLAGSGLVVFGRHFPSGTRSVVVYGGITVLAGAVALSTVWIFRDRLIGLLPDRLAAPLDRVQHGLFENLRSPWRSMGYSLVTWSVDGVRFLFVAWSLDALLSPPTALFLVLVAALAAATPVTPAGLGVVEVILLSVLPLVGVESDTATAIVVLERLVSYWSLILVGVPLYALAVRREVASTTGQEPAPL